MSTLKLDKFEEQIFFNTVLIENQTDGEFGTGFLLAKNIGEGRIKVLLFSNKHVFWGKRDQDVKSVKKKIEITLHKEDATQGQSLGDVQRFNFELNRDEIRYYKESKESDVAAVDITAFYNLGTFKSGMILLEYEKFCQSDYSGVYCGQEILFIGYPTGFYDKKNFLPVMRKGSISSIPSVDFNGRKEILVDAGVYPGSSGSPVFVAVDAKYRLLGIISQAVYKQQDFFSVPTLATETKGVSKIPIEWIGLGILIKIEAIREISDQF